MGKKRKIIFLIGGDFNLLDINWESMRADGTQYPTRVSQAFLDIVADYSLEQMVDFPTRKDKTLDLLFTSHPSYVEKCKPLPSIGTATMTLFFLTQASYFDHPSLSDERFSYGRVRIFKASRKI